MGFWVAEARQAAGRVQLCRPGWLPRTGLGSVQGQSHSPHAEYGPLRAGGRVVHQIVCGECSMRSRQGQHADRNVFPGPRRHRQQGPKGPQAARLRQRKFSLVRQFHSPRICCRARSPSPPLWKPTCHCASGEGHRIWFLTFMAQGKHVERIPKDWVDDVRSVSRPVVPFRTPCAKSSLPVPSCWCDGESRSPVERAARASNPKLYLSRGRHGIDAAGGCEPYGAAQRLLRRAVEHLGSRFADYLGDGAYATAPSLHAADAVELPVVARLKQTLPQLAAAVRAFRWPPQAVHQERGARVEVWDAEDFDPWETLDWPRCACSAIDCTNAMARRSKPGG